MTIPAPLDDQIERVLVAPGDDRTDELAEELRAMLGVPLVELEVWGHDVSDTDDGLRISFKVLRRVRASG